MREPRGSSSGERSRSGSRASPAKTTQSSCLLSSSLLARMRSSREHGGEGFLGLVDDEDGAAATGGDVVGPAGAKGLEPGPAVVSGEGDGEEVSELAVEVHGAALGVLDGADEDIGQRAKSLGEQTQGDALSGAGVAGEHGEAAVGDTELDAPNEAVDGGCGEERVVRDVGAEGVELQSVEREQLAHGSSGGSSVGSCLGR